MNVKLQLMSPACQQPSPATFLASFRGVFARAPMDATFKTAGTSACVREDGRTDGMGTADAAEGSREQVSDDQERRYVSAAVMAATGTASGF